MRAAFVSRLDRGEDLHLLDPEALEELKCVGLLNTDWFRSTVMRGCLFLRKLVISGSFLYCRCLGKVRKKTRDSAGVFPHLAQLDIFIREREIEELLEAKYRVLGGTGRYTETEISHMRMADDYDIRHTIQLNMKFLLTRIRSGCLTSLQIALSDSGLVSREDTFGQWKSNTIEKFLEFHRQTLRWLYLPGFLGPAFTAMTLSSPFHAESRAPPEGLRVSGPCVLHRIHSESPFI